MPLKSILQRIAAKLFGMWFTVLTYSDLTVLVDFREVGLLK